MKQVHYGGTSLAMPDDTARLLVDYARVLGAHGGSDAVAVPVLRGDGRRVVATYVLTHSAPLVVEPADSTPALEDEPQVLADIRARIERVDHPRARELGEDGAWGDVPDGSW